MWVNGGLISALQEFSGFVVVPRSRYYSVVQSLYVIGCCRYFHYLSFAAIVTEATKWRRIQWIPPSFPHYLEEFVCQIVSEAILHIARYKGLVWLHHNSYSTYLLETVAFGMHCQLLLPTSLFFYLTLTSPTYFLFTSLLPNQFCLTCPFRPTSQHLWKAASSTPAPSEMTLKRFSTQPARLCHSELQLLSARSI